MFDRPYHPCPFCRNNLTVSPKVVRDHPIIREAIEEGWIRWECQACGTIVWAKPFARKPWKEN